MDLPDTAEETTMFLVLLGALAFVTASSWEIPVAPTGLQSLLLDKHGLR